MQWVLGNYEVSIHPLCFLFLAALFSSLRYAQHFEKDALLAFDPLGVEHVKRCNQAEAEFWKKNEGYQTKPSDQLLQFDCGGQVGHSLICPFLRT